jgi:putative redox protein
MNSTIKAHIGKAHYKTTLTCRSHTLLADEPESLGGTDLGPESGELLNMALAACTTITLRMYADRKGWDLEAIDVEVSYEKTENGHRFHRKLHLSGNLDDDQRKRLFQIAERCPVHKILTHPIEIQTMNDGQ